MSDFFDALREMADAVWALADAMLHLAIYAFYLFIFWFIGSCGLTAVKEWITSVAVARRPK